MIESEKKYTKKKVVKNDLHLNLSTSRPSHSVESAVFTDKTRIRPTPSLNRKTRPWNHDFLSNKFVFLPKNVKKF